MNHYKSHMRGAIKSKSINKTAVSSNFKVNLPLITARPYNDEKSEEKKSFDV